MKLKLSTKQSCLFCPVTRITTLGHMDTFNHLADSEDLYIWDFWLWLPLYTIFYQLRTSSLFNSLHNPKGHPEVGEENKKKWNRKKKKPVCLVKQKTSSALAINKGHHTQNPSCKSPSKQLLHLLDCGQSGWEIEQCPFLLPELPQACSLYMLGLLQAAHPSHHHKISTHPPFAV